MDHPRWPPAESRQAALAPPRAIGLQSSPPRLQRRTTTRYVKGSSVSPRHRPIGEPAKDAPAATSMLHDAVTGWRFIRRDPVSRASRNAEHLTEEVRHLLGAATGRRCR